MSDYKNLEKEIQKLKERNTKVEAGKAWETSVARKLIVSLITYIVIVVFFFFAGLPKPFVNAVVPAIGFMLSTLSVSIFKKLWIEHVYKKP